MSSTESGQLLGWHQTDDLDCDAWLKESSFLHPHLAAILHTWLGHLPLLFSQAEFLIHCLQDLTVSVLHAKMAGNSWGDYTNAKTG